MSASASSLLRTSTDAVAGASTSAGTSARAAAPDFDSEAGPQAGGNEFEIWSGGGPSIHGGIEGLGAWNAGFRYGWVLTGLHGPGPLRGHGEYAVDAAPIFWVLQPGGNAYGVELVPMVLKWDFATRGRVVPYFDLDGGVLFTNRDTPPGISRVNFTPSGAIGAHFLLHRYFVSAEFRLLHISDAGLTNPNPGINTLEVRLGLGIFTHSK
jgi:hypothetical protein